MRVVPERQHLQTGALAVKRLGTSMEDKRYESLFDEEDIEDELDAELQVSEPY